MRYQTPNLPEVRHFFGGISILLGRTGRPRETPVPKLRRKRQKSAINISPGLLTDAAAGVITRSCRMTASPERKENRAFFIIGDSHQGPDHLDVPPAPVWRLKLPNSLKRASWSEGEFGLCPAGRARRF